MTPYSAWQSIAKYLPQDKMIWEPFYGDGTTSGEHLRSLGFQVIHKNIDFFDSNEGDIIVRQSSLFSSESNSTTIEIRNKQTICVHITDIATKSQVLSIFVSRYPADYTPISNPVPEKQ